MTLPSQDPDLERETPADRQAARRRLTMDYPVQLQDDPDADQLRRDAGLDPDGRDHGPRPETR